MSLSEDTNLIVVLARSLLNSISEVTALMEGVDIEQENFMEVGSYLDRTSPAIIELQMAENAPSNATEILGLISKHVDLARDLVSKCSTGAQLINDPELKTIIEQLERVIRNIGCGLSLIPSTTFENRQYVEIAVRSLSREMQSACLKGGGFQIQMSELEESKEQDLYSVDLVEREIEYNSMRVEVSEENSQPNSGEHSNDIPRLIDFLRGISYGGSETDENSNSQPFKSLPQVAQYMEPLYETFFCPLTQKMMDDPVTIGSGVTYERRAIEEWFKKSNDGSDCVFCPTTGRKLESRVLNTNIALKTTIEQWKERNEVTRIKVARAALSLASSETMVIEAMKDLQHLCRRRQYNKVQMRSVGMIPLLCRFLESEEKRLRSEAVETLRMLVEDGEEGKEMIVGTNAITATIKMLSSDYPLERHSALLLLLELSRSELLSQTIGSAAGAILVLITMKYNQSIDAFAAEKANETLKNLENCHKNIKRMAENGLLEPLLDHLIEGSEEMQMEMGSYLGEIVLGQDAKTYVAERASAALLRMVHNGNSLARKAAFKALVQISSHHPNSRTLVDAGIIPIMTEEMFTRKIYNEPMNSKEESATILANVLESGLDPESLQVNTHGHTMASDYIIYNFAHMIKNSSPENLNINLIKILLCLMQSPRSTASVVSVIKETESSYTLIELLDTQQDELSIASAKLLISLSTQMGHTLADQICKTRGQPESLIKTPEGDRITEKYAVWANLLAKLPHQNLTLNLALLHKETVPTILQRVDEIQRGATTTTSRFARYYLEGLVGILVRFTTTLYDQNILSLARDFNLASVFTGLLMRAGSDEVQRLSALGLENLSSESIHLSKPPQKIKKPKLYRFLPRCLSIGGPHPDGKLNLCPVHRGSCSSQTTFCLVESRAVERLLACLEHENVGVVEAALSAMCTLLDDKVDVERSVGVLSEVNLVQHVLNLLKEHREEGVWQKSFWVIERFLMKGGDRSASDISQDRLLPSTLVSAFHHGDSSTRQMAEKILRHLNKMPNFSSKVVL
ncbi:putative U-box domain-containing protein 42 [Magnolia sinica]|uniref:putative U-box domain-containing protein 42 n=1 Tax=Magnolia sinica TaxID=86752 RepID=UPI00265891D0|nr:putative U-box domain-containing protein 42 [Magnolia sinica]